MLLIKAFRFNDQEITAKFMDPTGEIDGYFHRKVVEKYAINLTVGTGVILKNVTVLVPLGSANHYLNIVIENLIAIFPHDGTQPITISHDHVEKIIGDGIQRNIQDNSVETVSKTLDSVSTKLVLHKNIVPLKPNNSEGDTGKKWAWGDLVKQNRTNDKTLNINTSLATETRNDIPPPMAALNDDSSCSSQESACSLQLSTSQIVESQTSITLGEKEDVVCTSSIEQHQIEQQSNLDQDKDFFSLAQSQGVDSLMDDFDDDDW